MRHGLPRRLAPWMPCGAHQALDVVSADALAGAPQRQPHLAIAVGVVVGGVQLADRPEQPLVSDRAPRALPAGAVVVGGRRHVQDPADRLDAEAAAVLIDERGSPRPVLVELLGKKHRGGFEDLVGATQLEVLGAQLADLLALRPSSADPAARRYRPPPGAPSYAASRDGCPGRPRHARSAGRSPAPAGSLARSVHRGTSSDEP